MQKILQVTIGFFIAISTLTMSETKAQLLLQRSVSGEIIGVHPLCSAHENCIVDGTVVNLKFQLLSRCSNLLLSYTVDSTDNNVEIVALEELDPDDNCLTTLAEPRFASISVQNMHPPMVISFVGTGISIPIFSENVVREMHLFVPEENWWRHPYSRETTTSHGCLLYCS